MNSAPTLVWRPRSDRVPKIARSSRTPGVGDQIGSYKLVAALASGGMGQVFRAEHVVLRRLYAVKVLHARARLRDPHAGDRLHAEARAAARVRHDGVVGMVDAGHTDGGCPYVVMELVAGESVSERVEQGPLPAAVAIGVALQAAHALAAVHASEVIHGDVSPTNLIVDRNGRVTLIDFGLARVRGEVDLDCGDMVLGTPSYMAPEQFRGEPSSEASDQYALGSVIHEMLTGAPPFEAASVRELYLAKLCTPVPAPTSLHGGVPPQLAALIARCLAPEPTERFASVSAVAAALDRIAREETCA